MAGRRWSARDDDRLVDLFYDAALDEALWPSLLEQLGDRVGAHPANLTQINFLNGHGFGLAARAPDDIMTRYFADWAQLNPIALAENPAAYPVGWMPRITRDTESVDRRTLERSAFWNEFLVPIGAYHLIIARLTLRGDNVTTVTFGRPSQHGAIEEDEIAALRPFHRHLVRAERIWRGLGLRQAAFDQFDALLATSSDAMFFLDDQFRVVRQTVAAEALLRAGSGLRVVGGQLRTRHAGQDAILQRALVTALRGGAPSPLVLVGATPADRLTLSVARLGERGLAGATGARCLLVSVRSLARDDPAGALRACYGLTAAEADLALALRDGDSLRAAAARRGVSFYTARNQLAAIFDKTGCRRQPELIRLLLSPLGQ